MTPMISSQQLVICRALVLLSIGLLMYSPQAAAGDAAESFVQARIQAGQTILKDPAVRAEERHRRFRDLVLSITDMRRIALFTAGGYARDASQPDIAGFVAAYTEFSLSFYERALDRDAGQTIRVTGSARRAADDAVVTAEAARPDGRTATIGFRVRENDGGEPIITDVQVEGAWLALNQRSDFTAYLQQHRGDLAQLSRELERRTRMFRLHTAENEAQ